MEVGVTEDFKSHLFPGKPFKVESKELSLRQFTTKVGWQNLETNRNEQALAPFQLLGG